VVDFSVAATGGGPLVAVPAPVNILPNPIEESEREGVASILEETFASMTVDADTAGAAVTTGAAAAAVAISAPLFRIDSRLFKYEGMFASADAMIVNYIVCTEPL
jgi:hypothetical protein